MGLTSFLQLMLLAAIWGSSFLFMKIAAGSLGPAVLIEARLGLAAVTLLCIGLVLRRKLAFAGNVKHFFIIGFFNSALPWMLFAYAALTLKASTLSVLNSTAPIWAALLGMIWNKTLVTRQAALGLLLGVSGVAVLVGFESGALHGDSSLAIAATLVATFCYAVATLYTKSAATVSVFDNAHGSMWAASLLALPVIVFIPVREPPTFEVMTAVVALGVLCTAVALLLYFRLVDQVGAASALSVTFLIPVFGILWAYLILDEAIGPNTLSGTVLIIAGTMLLTGFSPRALLAKRK